MDSILKNALLAVVIETLSEIDDKRLKGVVTVEFKEVE